MLLDITQSSEDSKGDQAAIRTTTFVVVGIPLVHLLLPRFIHVRAIIVIVATDVLTAWKVGLVNFVSAKVTHTSVTALGPLGLVIIAIRP